MIMPPTIIAVATSRKVSILLPGFHSRNVGKIRLRIRAKMTTKIGRLPVIVETSDTGPFCIAQSDSITPLIAKASLKKTKPIAEFLRFRLLSCLKVRGRIEKSRNILDMQNALIQNKLRNEI